MKKLISLIIGCFLGSSAFAAQDTMLYSQPVVIASDQSPVAVTTVGGAGTGSVSTDYSASGTITTQNLNPNSGVATTNSTVTFSQTFLNSIDNVSVQVTGVWTGTLTAQMTIDGVNWVASGSVLNFNTGAQSTTITTGATGIFEFGAEGAVAVRVTATAAVTGTATVTLRGNMTDSTVAIDSPIPAGTNLIGGVNLSQIGGAAVSNLSPGLLGVEGPFASGGTLTSSGPVLVGGVTGTLPAAALAGGKVTFMSMSSDLQTIVHNNGDPVNEWTATSGTTPLATATSTQLQTAQGTGIRNFVTDIHLVNTSATVSTTVSILDNATVIWTTFLPATTAALPIESVTIRFETPLKGTAATALNIQCGTTAAAVYYDVGGFHNN